jgi:hypothetical protein
MPLRTLFVIDYEQPVMWVKKATVPNNPSYHAIATAIYGESGLKMDAKRESDWLLESEPALVKNLRREVSMRFARLQDVDFFIDSSRNVGLPIAN